MTPEQDGNIRPQPEILRSKEFSGVYARFILASQSPTEMAKLLNPALDVNVPTHIEVSPDINFGRITNEPSIAERRAAWPQGIEFRTAYTQWRKEVKKAVTHIKDKDGLEAVRILLPNIQSATDFRVGQAVTLFETYCDGKSDTDAFIKKVITNLTTNEDVDTQKLAGLIPHLEWISGMLFGKQTAAAVSRMIELKAKIKNAPDEVIPTLFSDKTRMNPGSLTEPEKQILASLYNGLGTKRRRDKSV